MPTCRSVRPAARSSGTKTEIKNMNSFRSVQRAIDSEIERQIKRSKAADGSCRRRAAGTKRNGITHSMRSKEQAHDYRYFPDPDLVPMEPRAEVVAQMRTALPELPWRRFERFTGAYGLNSKQAAQLVENRAARGIFDRVVTASRNPQQSTNFVLGELSRLANESGVAVAQSVVTPENVAELIGLVDAKTINSKIAKDLLGRMWEGAGSPKAMVEEDGLAQTSDAGAIGKLVDDVLAKNEQVVADYRAGKTNVAGFLVGQIMKASGGKADPTLVRELLQRRLE